MDIEIEHLEDVLPHIDFESGIIHSAHQGYSVINYVFSLDHTFDSALARECRGLKFASDGRLIARPFHKFFNLGEKCAPQQEPWDQAHVVMDKLDGSMVHPAYVGDDLVFMTRMGLSAQARMAHGCASAGVLSLCRDMLSAGYTPIFEFTAPQNRVVVAYDAPELTLLAIRHMRSGAYMPHGDLGRLAAQHDVATVQTFGTVGDVSQFWTQARALDGVEGYVIAFENGHRVKVKADAYVLRHKALAGLAHEKNVLAWVVHGAVDDVVPLLSPDAAAFITTYQDQVQSALSRLETEITDFVQAHSGFPRKEFAAHVKDALAPPLQSVAFRALDGHPIRAGLLDVLTRASGSDTKVEAIRPLFGMRWQDMGTVQN